MCFSNVVFSSVANKFRYGFLFLSIIIKIWEMLESNEFFLTIEKNYVLNKYRLLWSQIKDNKFVFMFQCCELQDNIFWKYTPPLTQNHEWHLMALVQWSLSWHQSVHSQCSISCDQFLHYWHALVLFCDWHYHHQLIRKRLTWKCWGEAGGSGSHTDNSTTSN